MRECGSAGEYFCGTEKCVWHLVCHFTCNQHLGCCSPTQSS